MHELIQTVLTLAEHLGHLKIIEESQWSNQWSWKVEYQGQKYILECDTTGEEEAVAEREREEYLHREKALSLQMSAAADRLHANDVRILDEVDVIKRMLRNLP